MCHNYLHPCINHFVLIFLAEGGCSVLIVVHGFVKNNYFLMRDFFFLRINVL